MGLPEEDQTQLYDHYWNRMEVAFRNAGGGFDYFLRDYIALKRGSTTQPLADRIYTEFKSFWPGSDSTGTH